MKSLTFQSCRRDSDGLTKALIEAVSGLMSIIHDKDSYLSFLFGKSLWEFFL